MTLTATVQLARPSRVGPGIALIKSMRAWMNGTEATGLDEAAMATTCLVRQREVLRCFEARDRAALAVVMLAAGYT